jgi:hypothetical protein
MLIRSGKFSNRAKAFHHRRSVITQSEDTWLGMFHSPSQCHLTLVDKRSQASQIIFPPSCSGAKSSGFRLPSMVMKLTTNYLGMRLPFFPLLEGIQDADLHKYWECIPLELGHWKVSEGCSLGIGLDPV